MLMFIDWNFIHIGGSMANVCDFPGNEMDQKCGNLCHQTKRTTLFRLVVYVT